MHNIFTIAVKGVAGGVLVVAFSLLSEGLTPKRFAGLFSAAPAVAIAGLAVTLLDEGHHDAHQSAVAMIAGAAGMVAYAAVVVPLLRRLPSRRAATAATGAWAAVSALVLLPVLLA